jgi:hypothetical protein
MRSCEPAERARVVRWTLDAHARLPGLAQARLCARTQHWGRGRSGPTEPAEHGAGRAWELDDLGIGKHSFGRGPVAQNPQNPQNRDLATSRRSRHSTMRARASSRRGPGRARLAVHRLPRAPPDARGPPPGPASTDPRAPGAGGLDVARASPRHSPRRREGRLIGERGDPCRSARVGERAFALSRSGPRPVGAWEMGPPGRCRSEWVPRSESRGWDPGERRSPGRGIPRAADRLAPPACAAVLKSRSSSFR